MLTLEQRYKIKFLFEQKMALREISRKLNIAYTTIQNFVARRLKHEDTGREQGSGRFPNLSFSQTNELIDLKEANNLTSPAKLAGKLKEKLKIAVCGRTVRRYLKSAGYCAGKLACKPMLTKVQIERRRKICTEWSFKSDEYWNNVIFSDETKFNLKNSDGQQYVWKKPSERLLEKNICKTYKFGGGNVMFWGCFSRLGIGHLSVIRGKMDRYDYVNILRSKLTRSATKMGLENYKFQQDNDPKHTSGYTKEFFARNNVEVVDWPSQSPDLNPIENLWAFIKRSMQGLTFTKEQDLIDYVFRVWNEVMPELCKKLVDSMNNRITAVLRAKGGYTKY